MNYRALLASHLLCLILGFGVGGCPGLQRGETRTAGFKGFGFEFAVERKLAADEDCRPAPEIDPEAVAAKAEEAGL